MLPNRHDGTALFEQGHGNDTLGMTEEQLHYSVSEVVRGNAIVNQRIAMAESNLGTSPSRMTILLLLTAVPVFGQGAPSTPEWPWHSAEHGKLAREVQRSGQSSFAIDPDKIYSLAELVDLAEAHNPQTRVAWQNARAQAEALGIARSELYPTLSALALAAVYRVESGSGSRFYRQTMPDSQLTLELDYTIFDFGARRGRMNAASARLLASNLGFNDVHRQLIYQVQQAYYRLLNASAQETAARASLDNAEAVQQAAEARLKNGLATLPDVLEARSATAQAQYDLQALLGAEQIARGDLATAMGASANTAIRVQPFSQLSTPKAVEDTVEQVIDRALEQRPDLQAEVASVREANADRNEARAALYPTLGVTATPTAQSLSLLQQNLPWGHTSDLTGAVAVSLNWTVFDGGARKRRVAQSEAQIRQAEAQVQATRDQIENEVWTAYSNLNTAFRQREAATALLDAAAQSDALLRSRSLQLRRSQLTRCHRCPKGP